MRRRGLLIGVGVAFIVAIVVLLTPRRIDQAQAVVIAERMLAQYRSRAGEPPSRFGPRQARQWADGWEFRWPYRPCEDKASLRIWISTDGSTARYAELPDCLPQRGFSVGTQSASLSLATPQAAFA
jgi:hypothetical protein